VIRTEVLPDWLSAVMVILALEPPFLYYIMNMPPKASSLVH
jgi:hypothetical protein